MSWWVRGTGVSLSKAVDINDGTKPCTELETSTVGTASKVRELVCPRRPSYKPPYLDHDTVWQQCERLASQASLSTERGECGHLPLTRAANRSAAEETRHEPRVSPTVLPATAGAIAARNKHRLSTAEC